MRAMSLLASSLVVAACALVMVASACGAFGSGESGETSGSDAGAKPADGGAPSDPEASAADARADAPPPTNDPGVFCGGAYCDPAHDVCCRTLPGGGAGCVPKDADGGVCPGLRFACDDNIDCVSVAATVCCGTIAADDKSLFSTACLPLLDCKKDAYWVVVCDPNASTACPGGEQCSVPDGGGYGFCDGLRYH